MARSTSTNYSTPSFPKATADIDAFDATDVQQLAAAVDGHDHSTGKGIALAAGAIGSGLITSTMIADGTIATADLANSSVTNAKLASDTARLNLLTNGGFEMWQRGNGPFVGAFFSADRWQAAPGAGATVSVSRDTTNVDASSIAAAAVTYTHGGTVSTFNQLLEGSGILGRPVTLSIRVRTSTANAVRARMWIGAAEVLGTTHTGGGGWETLTVTGTPTTALYSGISLMASCTAYVDNAMLVVGSVAADYAPLHPADDLARCLRYYEVVGSGINVYPFMAFSANGAHVISTPIPFAVRKAITPTLTKNGTWSASNCGQPAADFPNTAGYRHYVTATAAGGGNSQPADGGCFIAVEANP